MARANDKIASTMATVAERIDLEKKSAAVTLSDMEVFIFPELMYALVLANMMSPRVWAWRQDAWFGGLAKMKPHRRIMRLKQYVMDHYAFNLDLDTWGLTTTERELARFRDVIDERTLAQSNALFGYEGDRYYFDIGIRKHFGLDAYSGNVIPYWKTETVEAMDAFVHRPNYTTGAGECVSLATLYATALFLVCGIPLADLFLMATPLHSQNFVDMADGILTNNRRLVTKAMWFNGTALSAQARRALQNERVTIVAHETGLIHTLYPDATIDPAAYRRFGDRLQAFLRTPLTPEILGNFIRDATDLQRCFQFRWPGHGRDRYIAMEKALQYEYGSPSRLTDHTREKLVAEMDVDQFEAEPIPSRIVFNRLEEYLREQPVDIDRPEDVRRLKHQFASDCLNAEVAIESLVRFCRTPPRLPDASAKRFSAYPEPLGLTSAMSREEVIARLESLRGRHPVADLAFYAYRDLNRTGAEPFVRAAVQRCPVSVEGSKALSDEELAARVRALPELSIYDGPGRLAQPDEVWNFGRGDGAEKALLLANVLRARRPGDAMRVRLSPDRAVLETESGAHEFASSKGLREQEWTIPGAE